MKVTIKITVSYATGAMMTSKLTGTCDNIIGYLSSNDRINNRQSINIKAIDAGRLYDTQELEDRLYEVLRG